MPAEPWIKGGVAWNECHALIAFALCRRPVPIVRHLRERQRSVCFRQIVVELHGLASGLAALRHHLARRLLNVGYVPTGDGKPGIGEGVRWVDLDRLAKVGERL